MIRRVMILKLPFSKYNLRIERAPKSTMRREATSPDRGYNKIFVIGFGKTGTTTLWKLLKKLGFRLGNQQVAEILAEDWIINKRVDRIIDYCYTGDAFQDIPFSTTDLYKELDKHFPNSKFVLSVRDSDEQWYRSMVKYSTKLFSRDKNRLPNLQDLEEATYRYKGWILKVMKYVWNYPQVPLFDEAYFKSQYNAHSSDVQEYFKDRPDDLITINVSDKKDFKRLCDFLNVKTDLTDFPWENKTQAS